MNRAIITVTPDLSERDFGEICKHFNKKCGTELEFERINDPALIGGFVAEIDGEVYDTSIKTKLEQLKRHIR